MKNILLILIVVIIGYSCSTVTKSIMTQDTHIIGNVKPVAQDIEETPIPPILKMVMEYYGIKIDKKTISDGIGETWKQAFWGRAAPFLEKYGLKLNWFEGILVNNIENYLKNDIPVIVGVKWSIDKYPKFRGKPELLGTGSVWNHAILVVGFDQKNYYIINPLYPYLEKMLKAELEEMNKGRQYYIILKSNH